MTTAQTSFVPTHTFTGAPGNVDLMKRDYLPEIYYKLLSSPFGFWRMLCREYAFVGKGEDEYVESGRAFATTHQRDKEIATTNRYRLARVRQMEARPTAIADTRDFADETLSHLNDMRAMVDTQVDALENILNPRCLRVHSNLANQPASDPVGNPLMFGQGITVDRNSPGATGPGDVYTNDPAGSALIQEAVGEVSRKALDINTVNISELTVDTGGRTMPWGVILMLSEGTDALSKDTSLLNRDLNMVPLMGSYLEGKVPYFRGLQVVTVLPQHWPNYLIEGMDPDATGNEIYLADPVAAYTGNPLPLYQDPGGAAGTPGDPTGPGFDKDFAIIVKPGMAVRRDVAIPTTSMSGIQEEYLRNYFQTFHLSAFNQEPHGHRYVASLTWSG